MHGRHSTVASTKWKLNDVYSSPNYLPGVVHQDGKQKLKETRENTWYIPNLQEAHSLWGEIEE